MVALERADLAEPAHRGADALGRGKRSGDSREVRNLDLVSNIQQRGRDYEQRIALDYLQGLNERYEDFIYHHYKGRVLTVEVDNLDFLHRPADFEQITRRIDGLLFGLFN